MGFSHSDIPGSKHAKLLPEAYRSHATSFIAFASQGIHYLPVICLHPYGCLLIPVASRLYPLFNYQCTEHKKRKAAFTAAFKLQAKSSDIQPLCQVPYSTWLFDCKSFLVILMSTTSIRQAKKGVNCAALSCYSPTTRSVMVSL